MGKSTCAWPAALLLASACSGDGMGTDLFGSESADVTGMSTTITASGTASASSTASGTATDTASTDGVDSSTTEDVKFDVGTPADLPGACKPDDENCGCTAVDILFVVDNSGSMQEHAAPTVGPVRGPGCDSPGCALAIN